MSHLLITILLIIAMTVQHALTSTSAGIYVDNGHDQTMMERAMTSREQREIELEILHLLGLPDRPRYETMNAGGEKLRRAAPRFLMDVYQSLLAKENGEESGLEVSRIKRELGDDGVMLSGEEKMAIDESDVIMTFENKYQHVNVLRHERGKRFWFNVTDIPTSESIVGAELRIFKSINEKTEKKPKAVYTVTAYQLINTDDGERELEFITAVNTTAEFTGWLELNLTSCLANWVVFPESNKGLYLSVHPLNKPAHEVRPEDVGLLIGKDADDMQSFMVAFLKATNRVNVRTTRDTRRARNSQYPVVMKGTDHYDHIHHTSESSCRIHTLHISFKDLKWQDWIIAPEAYAAYYCAGECNFPLNSHMNATNHAIVQTLVHLLTNAKYPKPCCAPTKLTPISVLYYNDDSNVILKKYKKMVVKSCGCH